MASPRQNPTKKTFPRKPDSRKKPNIVIPNAGLGRGEKAKTYEGKAQRQAERIDRNRKAAERSRAKARDEKKWQVDYIERLRAALRDDNLDQAARNSLLSEVFVWDESKYDATLAGNAPASPLDGQQLSDPALLLAPEPNPYPDSGSTIFPLAEGADALGTGAQFGDASNSTTIYPNGLAIDESEMSGLSYETGSQNPSNFESNVTITGGHNVFHDSSTDSNATFANFATNGSAASYALPQAGPHEVISPAISYPSNEFAENNLSHLNYGYLSDFWESAFAELQADPNPACSGEASGLDPYLTSWSAEAPHSAQYDSTSAFHIAPNTNEFYGGPLHGALDPGLPTTSNPSTEYEHDQLNLHGPFLSDLSSYNSESPS